MLGGGKASGLHSTGAVVGRGTLRGRDVDREWGGWGFSGKEDVQPRSQGEKALVAPWPLGPQEAVARSAHQQISL